MIARERPILFSAPMVRAILDGTKTQTRRVVKPQPLPDGNGGASWYGRGIQWAGTEAALSESLPRDACPYGQPGDRLWVRETFWNDESGFKPTLLLGAKARVHLEYDADLKDHDRDELRRSQYRCKPSIHMPRWASRITLEITDVRVQRLQECSEADALAEGIRPYGDGGYHVEEGRFYMGSPVASYCALWEHINGEGSWDANPWVWAISFRRVPA